jgi:hypothetical protein
MHTSRHTLGRNITTPVVSLATIFCSLLWLVSAGVYYANSGFRADWSATPLLWMLVVMVTPSVCFSGGLILLDARKRHAFSRLDRCALAAIILPVTFGTFLSVWAAKDLLAMSGH